MGRHTFLIVLAVSLAALALALLFPPPHEAPRLELLPWAIERTPDGGSRVFGLTLGASSVNDAERQLREPAEVSLFQSPDGVRAVEAYFDEMTLSGLRAKLVLEVALTVEERGAMFERGLRVSTLGDGSRKVTLHPDDLARVRQAPIASLTYLPKADLDPQLLEQRFGVPAHRIREAGSEVEHWLYPELGLDIGVNAKGKEVLQYLPPRDFARISTPLEAQAR